MSKESFDAYHEPDWEKLGLPSAPISVFCLPIKSHQIEVFVPVADEEQKPRDRRDYQREYQKKHRNTDEFRAKRRAANAKKRLEEFGAPQEQTPEQIRAHLKYVRRRMKQAAERVNPERSHGYTQADADKTAAIAGKPNHRRSA